MGNRKSCIPQVENEGKLLAEAQAIIIYMENNYSKVLIPLTQKVAECQSYVLFLKYITYNIQLRVVVIPFLERYEELTGEAAYLRRKLDAFESRLRETKCVHVKLMEAMDKYKKWFQADEILSLKDSDISELKQLLEADKRVTTVRSFNADRFEREWKDGNFPQQLNQCIAEMSTIFGSCGDKRRIYDDD